MRRIGVLTSGGDAPGMNACIRAVVRAGLDRGVEVVGLRRGFAGLLDGDADVLDRSGIVNIIHRGGTILGTSREPRMLTRSGRADAIAELERLEIEGVVMIGGDGTFRAAAILEDEGGPPTVGVPATIDNDIVGTDRALGFDTAVNTAVEAIDRVRDTAQSHELLHFVEVMGRKCGAIALASGLAGGAEAILTPELPMDDDAVADEIAAEMLAGKRSVIVVVAEGARPDGTADAARRIGERLHLDHRVTILGYVQRGGVPSASDRILGAMLGVEAIHALIDGDRGVFVGERAGSIVRAPYAAVADGAVPALDPELIETAALLA